MIKFFRHIRKSLLLENKTSKYFKYAIGEIVLVVIGILIALGINSMYNASKNEEKIKSILTQVQEDLVTDILDAQRIYNVRIDNDSTYRKIMNDSITFEMYKANPYPLPFGKSYVSFSTKTSGYNRLIDNLENLPEKYNGLLPHFNSLYVEMQNDIDDYNEHIQNAAMIDGRADFKTNPKLADYYEGRYPEEAMEYYFNNPFLRNNSLLFINGLSNISWAANDFRAESLLLYKKIDSLLEKTPNEYVEPLALLPSKEVTQPFVGGYIGTANTSGSTILIRLENGRLVVKDSENADTVLLWHQGDYYFVEGVPTVYKLYVNKEGQRILELSGYGSIFKFIKTNDL
jgi:hypothetical protein